MSKYILNTSGWLAECPVWRLANHTSGLIAHLRFYEELGPRVLADGNFSAAYQDILGQILSQSPAYQTGTKQVYSDLGYILLAHICESIDGDIRQRTMSLYGHGPTEIHWQPSKQRATNTDHLNYAATEQCHWRKRLMQMEVHDDNCWSMGGIAGHAGSFGTLESVHRHSCTWLDALRGRTNPLGISKRVLKESVSTKYEHLDHSRVLGWDRTSKDGSSAGNLFTPNSYGHLGFTGTSIWLDVEADVAVTLLTNRVLGL